MALIPTLLQSKTFSTASTSATNTVTLDSTVSFGSILIVGIVSGDPGGTAPSITDSLGNNYNPLQLSAEASSLLPNSYYDMYYTNSVSKAGADTLTFANPATGNTLMAVVFEFTNIPPGMTTPAITNGTPDLDAVNQGTGTQLDSTVNGASNFQGLSLLIGFGLNDGAQTMTSANGFNAAVNVTQSGFTYALAYKIQTVITTVDASFTMPGSANWVAGIAAFNVKNPINFVSMNGVSATSTTTSVTATYGTATTSGGVLLASVYSNGGTNAISGWTQIGDQVITASQHVSQYYKVANGSETTITATSAGSSIMNLHIYELSNAANPVVIDGTPAKAVINDFILTVGDITTTNANDVIFGSAGYAANTIFELTAGTGNLTMFKLIDSARLIDCVSFASEVKTGGWLVGGSVSTNTGGVLSAIEAAPAVPDPLTGSLGSVGAGS